MSHTDSPDDIVTNFTGPMLKEADERLCNGTWKEWIQDAMKHLIAGEDNAKWVLFYSGLSTNLPELLHVFLMGKSQKGKSFLQTQMGKLFEDSFLDISSITPKAIPYELKEKGDPHFYRNKIAYFDEYNDQSEESQRFVKAQWTDKNRARGSLRIYKTVKDQKYHESVIGDSPVVWTNSMERIEDDGNQKMNRFFPLNVDEGLAQSNTIEEFQIREEEGSVNQQNVDLAIDRAKAIIYLIVQKKNFEVRNPFARFIKLKDPTRHMRPKFKALLSSITYANRFNRVLLENEKRKILLSSLSDAVEALNIWHRNERFLRFGLADRYLNVLNLFTEGKWLSKEEIAKSYFEFHQVKISSDTAYQYAHFLEGQNLLTSRNRERERYQEYGLLEESTLSNNSNNQMLELEIPDEESLAVCLEDIFTSGLMEFQDKINIEELAILLIDTEIEKKAKEGNQSNLDADFKRDRNSNGDTEIINLMRETIKGLESDKKNGLTLEVVASFISPFYNNDTDRARSYFKKACENGWLPYQVQMDGRILKG